MLLLDLNFANVARVLNNLGNVRLVSAPDLTGDTLTQVCKSSIHPVLPEDGNTSAKGRKVGRNHAESTVDGPEQEEDDEEVVHVPETLKVCTTRTFGRRECNSHQTNQHDVATPAGTGGEVGENETHESEVVVGGEAGQVVPMGNGVNPGEEDNGPGDQLVEGDVLVKGNYVVERRTTGNGDEIPAYREQDKGYVNMEHKRS